ncbi:nitrate- and nitrite sensing domain-containing protein, partial [Micromonospora sp. KC213]|uniref:sensor histidine kinase n=1 Tax=Micromonospora sp. KC213 TaxID=2530378 RepID=UPI001052858E
MRSGSANLRAKVVALLLSLVALWSFAAWVTLRDGVNLLGVQAMDSQIIGPSEPLLLNLQVERRLSTAQLGTVSGARQAALAAERNKVDEAAAAFRSSARSWLARTAANDTAERHVDDALAALDRLPATRQSIDGRQIGRAEAATVFTELIEVLFRLYDVAAALDDTEIEADTRNLIELYRMRELVSQEDALMTGALAAGRMTAPEHTRFTQLVAAHRFLTDRTAPRLRNPEHEQLEAVLTGSAFADLRRLEDRVLASDRDTAKPAIGAQEWNDAAESSLNELQKMVLANGDALVERATPVAVGVVVRLVLAAGLGLLAVIASVIVSITTARALVAQLQRLQVAAHKLADERLPSVVERLGHGEKVDVAKEAPPLDFGDDEIGQVGQAFNRVQETAIRTAVEQAELRRNVRDVFLSLARRTQGLVHRQVTLLDAMERREQDAEELEDLFRVDHLAVRMRRNAENLVVLSGATPARAWRRDVPMLDVARAATQEVEDYARVTVQPFGTVGLAGRAVGDVIHLLAELIENALSFSPPHTEVQVRGQLVGRGFVVEIEDRGLGMGAEEMAAANEQIASDQEFSLSNANQLGLFVVSRLANKHHLTVQLKDSPYGGTTAVVLIPKELITNAQPVAPTGGPVPATAAASPMAEAQAPRPLTPRAPSVVTDSAAVAALNTPTPTLGLPQRSSRRDASTSPAATTPVSY